MTTLSEYWLGLNVIVGPYRQTSAVSCKASLPSWPTGKRKRGEKKKVGMKKYKERKMIKHKGEYKRKEIK